MQEREEEGAELVSVILTAVEEDRERDHGDNLAHLAWLKLNGADIEPALCSACGGPLYQNTGEHDKVEGIQPIHYPIPNVGGC